MNDSPENRPADKEFRDMMQLTMNAFAAEWSRGNIDGLMALVGTDPVYRTSGGAIYKGRDNVRSGFTAICKPGVEESPGSTPPAMHFFEDKCLSYWVLDMPDADGTLVKIGGVDVITFDDAGKIICKDAYRKLR